MLNADGPTAAQTVNPILNRSCSDLGLLIALLPSDVTIDSMKATSALADAAAQRWPGRAGLSYGPVSVWCRSPR